jgi:hypothetical protein
VFVGRRVFRRADVPNFMGNGLAFRVGASFETSRAVAIHVELAFDQLAPQSEHKTARLLQPGPNSNASEITTRGSGRTSSFAFNFGVQFAPERVQFGMIQPYALVSAVGDVTRFSEYGIAITYQTTDEPLRTFRRFLSSRLASTTAIGVGANAGLGVDIRVHRRYSLFAEGRGHAAFAGRGSRFYITPQIGISIALETSRYGRISL